jgi:hypothetical protein
MVDSMNLEERVTQLEHDRDVLAWLYAEMLYMVKLSVAQQLLQNPDLLKQVMEHRGIKT